MALIERELITKIESMTPEQFYRFIMTVCGAYLRQETAPVVHGRWVDNQLNGYKWAFSCSECGWIDGFPFNERHSFCPSCGARMCGGDGHETD